MEANITELLESLRPKREGMIMDLVAETGIDVSPWHVKKDGSAVRSPRANPNYCYEWAFGGNGEPTVLCVWHQSLKISQESITFEDSLRQYALKLDRLAIDRTNLSHVQVTRSRSGKARSKFRFLAAARLSEV